MSASFPLRTHLACATVILGCGTKSCERWWADWVGTGAATAVEVSAVMRGEATRLRGWREAGEGGGDMAGLGVAGWRGSDVGNTVATFALSALLMSGLG